MEEQPEKKTLVTLEIEMPSLQDMLGDLNMETRSYSGRRMNSKQCLGVKVDTQEELSMMFYDLGLELGRLLAKIEILGTVDQAAQEEIERHFRRELKNFRTDTMGHGVIVYWPEVAYNAE